MRRMEVIDMEDPLSLRVGEYINVIRCNISLDSYYRKFIYHHEC